MGLGAYSIYLFHGSIGYVSTLLLGGSRFVLLAAVTVTVAVSLLAWFAVERPAMRYARARWSY